MSSAVGEEEKSVPSEGEMSDDGECSEAPVESPAELAEIQEENDGELDFDEPVESAEDKSDKEDGEMEDSDEGQISSDEEEERKEVRVARAQPKEVEEGEVDDEDGSTPVLPEEKLREKGGICKFYARGQCTWGAECKFQHTGASKGNYQMFPDARPIASLIPPGGLVKGKMPPRYPAREKVEPVEIPPLIPPLIPRVAGAADDTESAWERGLKQAKELMKKSAVRHEGDGGELGDSPKKSAIPSLIQADLVEPGGRRPSSYESSEPDRSDAGSNRGSRKAIVPPEGEIGPFVNRGGINRDRPPYRNNRNFQNYPDDQRRDDYRNQLGHEGYERRYEEPGDFGDDGYPDRGRVGDYGRQPQRQYNNRGGRGNFRGSDNFEPPVYPLIGPTGRPDGFYNRGGDNRNRRGNNNRRDNQYRQERVDEGRPLPYELPANRNYDAEWNDPWSRSARPESRRRSGSSSSGGSRAARRNRSSSSSSSTGSSASSASKSRSTGSSTSSRSSSKRSKAKPTPIQPTKPQVPSRPQQNRPVGQIPQIPVKKIPLPNTSPSQSVPIPKKQKSSGVLSPPVVANRQNSPLTKPVDDRSPIKLTIVNRVSPAQSDVSSEMTLTLSLKQFQSKVKNVAEGGDPVEEQDRFAAMQNKRKSEDSARRAAQNSSASGGNSKLAQPAGKRQKVEKPSGGSSSAGTDKSTKSRREELLRQLKAVEDAIARKRSKIS